MIYKFTCHHYESSEIQVQRIDKDLRIDIKDDDVEEYATIFLNEKEVFNLIGALLRIQSEIKKEATK